MCLEEEAPVPYLSGGSDHAGVKGDYEDDDGDGMDGSISSAVGGRVIVVAVGHRVYLKTTNRKNRHKKHPRNEGGVDGEMGEGESEWEVEKEDEEEEEEDTFILYTLDGTKPCFTTGIKVQ